MGKLAVRMVDKPWGKDVLPAPFVAPAGERIGEVWFVPPPEVPSLLVKYIFTSQALSVQVHPSDAQAEASGETARTGWGGKEECWLVIDAEPGATLGVGFAGHLDEAAMRSAALDGSIEDLLVWHPVQAGDFFYIPAGTVHAIGAGVSLIEIQQNSDITYRLYDYGRPRELHLDAGLKVARGEPLDPLLHRTIPAHGTIELASGRYFTATQVEGLPDAALTAAYDGPLLVIPRLGTVRLADGTELHPGDCASAENLASVGLSADGQAILVKPA
ncbi:class I mannose-6-phosphate isomerase [Novosphingobium sp. FKTRR1]|uniref:class I mannose-6-phosphate isomerase n=1 Tax=Novosphingobium sp. FKTRR1 TaxID=2879118 RepID=UPI001CF06075|nr:class I mannose-6-phosphate isomerase [Novosphingobium sp. FKTRR1]